MGLHHDGEVDAFWLQLAGRRTVTIGPRVPPGTPEDLDDRLAGAGRRNGWRTLDLEPGTLFHLPARTPHAVVCRRRSLAITLTWGTRTAGTHAVAGQPRRVGRRLGIRGPDSAAPPRARSGPRCPVVARGAAASHRRVWTPMARGRGCPPAPPRGSISSRRCPGSRAPSRARGGARAADRGRPPRRPGPPAPDPPGEPRRPRRLALRLTRGAAARRRVRPRRPC